MNRHIERSDGGSFLTLPPSTATALSQAVSDQLQNLLELGMHPVVLCSPQIRLSLRRLLVTSFSNIAVIAYNEIVKGVQIESQGMAIIES